MTQAVSGAESAPAAADRPRYEPTQEVRFAVVLYGGSSLAIYINGVVQELLRLVRATAPAAAPTEIAYPDRLLLSDEELSGSEAVYRRLGQLLSWEQPARIAAGPSAGAPPVTTRFVVDILSGTSAGGINGIFLAKALANEEDLGKLRQLWFEEGDIAKLLNDQPSYEGVELEEQPPNSLLNSRRMYSKLLSALNGMNSPAGGSATGEHAPAHSRFVDELDLWITTTDIRGLTLPIALWDRVVYEKRYRNVFRLSYANPYTSDPDAEVRNDFVRDNDPLLAFAARCTSSLPFAFDPMELEDIDPIVRNQEFAQEYGNRGLDSERRDWSRFFPDYVPSSADDDLWYRRQAFADGGYLDNKPFTWATSALLRRRADLPVDRKLIYVEPDPGGLHALETTEADPVPRPMPARKQLPVGIEKPDALANTQAALLVLPRKEAIRDDLDVLLQRNRDLTRLERITKAIDVGDTAGWTISTEDWTTKAPTEHHPGLHYMAYNRLKIATVLDELAEVTTIVAGFDPDSDERSAIRCFVQAWYRRTGRNTGPAQAQFLLDFDLPYRLRRLQFLQDRIDEILRGDSGALEMLGQGGATAATAPELDKSTLLELKRELNGVLVRLRAVRRALRHRGEGNPVSDTLGAAPITRDQLIGVLWEARNQDESDRRALELLERQPGLAAAVDSVGQAVGTELAAAFKASDNDARAILVRLGTESDQATRSALAALLRFYDAYEAYDSVTLPISYGVTGESDRVEVIRVSPEDATGVVDEVRDGCRKLAGIQYGHLGGFFDLEWRQNDLMWGRLDAADRLISALLPSEPEWGALRDELARDAFRAILREERPADCPTDEAADAYMLTLATECAKRKTAKEKIIVKTSLDIADVLKTAGRAAEITKRVLETVETNVLTKPLVKGVRLAGGLGVVAEEAGKIVEDERRLRRWATRVRKILRFGRK